MNESGVDSMLNVEFCQCNLHYLRPGCHFSICSHTGRRKLHTVDWFVEFLMGCLLLVAFSNQAVPNICVFNDEELGFFS